MKSHGSYQIAHKEHGQSLVEFAITLPLLCLLLLGVVDLGVGFKTYIGLTNAAREGARWITINPDDPQYAVTLIGKEVSDIGLFNNEIGAGSYEVSFTPNKAEYAAGENVEITIHYDYEMLFGSLTNLPTIPFEASATMVVLYDE
jgi:hypothetical protein